MNRLDTKKQAQIIAALVEGNSIRATSRMTGAAMKAKVADHLWEIEDILALLNETDPLPSFLRLDLVTRLWIDRSF